MAKWERIGSINDSKYGGYTFEVTADCELKEGERLAMKKPQDDVQSLLDKGILSEEQAEERLEKIPSFVKYTVYKVPPKGE